MCSILSAGMSPVSSVLILIILVIKTTAALPPIIKIGAIFEENQKNSNVELAFKYAVHKVNKDKSILPHTQLIYDIQYVSKDDSFHASKKVCAQMRMGVQAIFGPSDPMLGTHIHSICDALDVPHLEARIDSDSNFKHGKSVLTLDNVNVNNNRIFSINLHPAQNLLNAALNDVMIYLNWTRVAILYEDDYSLIKLRQFIRQNSIEIFLRQTNVGSYFKILQEIKQKEIYNLIIDTRPDNIDVLMKGILQLQMNEYKYHYLFTTFDLESHDLEDFKYNFVNLTGFRLIDTDDIDTRTTIKDMHRYYDTQKLLKINNNERQSIIDTAVRLADRIQIPMHENLKYPFKNVTEHGNRTILKAINENDRLKVRFDGDRTPAPRRLIIETEPALMYDSVYVFAIGLQSLEQSHTLRIVNISCADETPWAGGLSLINYINSVERKGLTGPIEFKEGKRVQFKLDLIKLRHHALVKVGEWSPKAGLNITEREMFFDASAINVTLVVITILEIPYVMMNYGKNFTGNERFFGFCVDILERVAHEVGFDYILDLVPDKKYGAKDPLTGEWNGMVAQLMKHETPYVMIQPQVGAAAATHNLTSRSKSANVKHLRHEATNGSSFSHPGLVSSERLEMATPGDHHFTGFCIDLLKMIAKIVGFDYSIELVPDGKYGVYNLDTGEWNGIVRQLIDKKADLAVGSMTINYARESVIDFTKPFMNLGISILFKVPTTQPTRLFSFMNPLAVDIWLYVFAAYCLVSITMFVVARFSPYEWQNPHPCEMENNVVENQFTIANSFWFTIGTLMQQGSDLNPKATSTRIVGGIWWFFTLIIISSYTANLAAFLTVERMITPIENADDLAGQTEIAYGTLESGSTMTFFRDSMIETYKKMWRFMENKKPSVFTGTYTEGISRVLDGNYAFLMESTMLDYIVQRNCNLTQIGGLLDTKGYGIATPMGSPWRDKISLAILELQEKGEIQMLYNKWWKNPGDTCLRQDKSRESKANALGVDNIGGVFVVLLCGLAIAVLIAIVEFCYHSKYRDPLTFTDNGGGIQSELDLNDERFRTAIVHDTLHHQSLCAEMCEELWFALRCHGSRQRPALRRQCTSCLLSTLVLMERESVQPEMVFNGGETADNLCQCDNIANLSVEHRQ